MEQNSVGIISSQMNHQQGTEPSTSTHKETQMSDRNFSIQPSSKLELIEKFLNSTKSCELTASTLISTQNRTTKSTKPTSTVNLRSSSGIINTPSTALNTQNYCNKILNNLTLFDEPKIFSLQRSISEKLRNSFKNTTNNISLLSASAENKESDKEPSRLVLPRKWHSERGRPSDKYSKPPSSRFSTQVPLSSHYKDILANYAKTKPDRSCNKINNKISQLNKKLSLLTVNKKQSTAIETSADNNNNQKPTKEIDLKMTKLAFHDISRASDYENYQSFTSSSSDTESDVLNNKTSRKVRKNLVFRSKYRQTMMIHSDEVSIDTDVDSIGANDNVTEAADFDFNSRRDFIKGYFTQKDEPQLNTRLVTSKRPTRIYADVQSEVMECLICCDEQLLSKQSCCGFLSCNMCIDTYIQTQIMKSCGSIKIECLNSACTSLFHKAEIIERMTAFDKNSLKVYLKFLVDSNKNSSCKTCPRCSHIMTIENCEETRTVNKKSSKLKLKPRVKVTKVQCSECHLVWCFQCHAPWHNDISCSEFRKDDQMLKYWANEVHYGQQNAKVCPKCKIYIQRTKGCEHMICMFCQTNFCYKCGQKFRHIKFIGDHYNRLSVLGCKYRFYPEKPVKRRIIRGSILAGKILATPIVATLAAVIGIGAVVVGVVVLPTYGSYRLIKHIHNSTQKPGQNKEKIGYQTTNVLEETAPKVSTRVGAESTVVATAKYSSERSSDVLVNSNELNLIPREAITEPRIKEF